MSVDDADILSRVVERAIARSADRYLSGRTRLLEGLEKIADAAFNVVDLESFLDRLLHVFMEHAPSIDSVAILLRDGDRLTVRASIGLEDEVRARFTLKMGEGFSGTIAATGKPMALRNAAQDPLVRSPMIHARKTRALYGVPLFDRGEVVGVAHIGSCVDEEIPGRETRLFAALAQRATSAIIKHKLREQARVRAAELEAVIEAIPSAVFVGNAERITTTNAAGLRFLGLTTREELRAPLPALSQPLEVRDAQTGKPLELEATPYVRALRGEKASGEMLVRDLREGTVRVVRANAGPITDRGQVIGAAIALIDVTELHHAIQVLERTAEFRERLIGIVSHDLRNPLNAISMSAQIMVKSPELAPSLSKPAGRIVTNVERMTRMISDLLDFTRGRLGGGIPIEPGPVDLAVVARRVIDEYEQTQPTRHLEFEVHGNVRGTWDGDRLAQVLGNLVGNALQYGNPATPVRVRIDGHSASEVIVTVQNEGPPIPSELLPHLFNAFTRANHQEGSRGGLGLGLFIASEVLRAHGGSISVTSDERATTFTVALPRISSHGGT